MLVLLGYVVAVAAVVPDTAQLLRTFRLRHVRGLSALTQVSYLMSWLSWALYGLRLGDGPVILSSVLAAAVTSGMVGLLWRMGEIPSWRRLLLPAAVFAAAAVSAWALPGFGGVALAAADLTFFLPQMLLAYRSGDLSGISPAAVGVELSTAVGWVAYTTLSGIPEVGVFAAVQSVLLALLAWRMLRSRFAVLR